jgi:hypothetical protein
MIASLETAQINTDCLKSEVLGNSKTNDLKKYFYSDGKEKFGPLGFEELKKENILNETLIWYEGLDSWTPAKEIDEIKPILELKPPPILSEEKNESSELEESSTSKVILNLDKEIDEHPKSRPTKNDQSFNPFSFDGRIGRKEYLISFIIYFVTATIVGEVVESGEAPIIGLAYIPMLWFLWSQGAKRCHDVGKGGWWQFIPFYLFWLLFQEGQSGINEYGHKA